MELKEEITQLNILWKNALDNDKLPGKFNSLFFLKLKMHVYNMKKQWVVFSRVNAQDLPYHINKVALEYLDSIACIIQNKINILSTSPNTDEYDNTQQKLVTLRNQSFRKYPPADYPFFLKEENMVGCYNTCFADEDVILDMITDHGDWPTT